MAHDFSNTGTVVTGPSAETRPGAARLPETAKPDFWLMHHPAGWEAVQDETGTWEWLPKLKRLLLVPGVNGVRATRGGVDDGPARLNAETHGWKLLPRDLGYVCRYPSRSGRPSHYLTWDTPVVIGNRVRARHDADGYNEFRRSLVLDGVIAPPEPEALDAILEDIQHRIDRNSVHIHIPTNAKRVSAAKAKKEGATKAKAKAAKKPAPRKRRTVKKAAPGE